MNTYRLFWGWSANHASHVSTVVAVNPAAAIETAYPRWIHRATDSRFRDEALFVVFEVGGDLAHCGSYADAPGGDPDVSASGECTCREDNGTADYRAWVGLCDACENKEARS